MTAGCDRLRYHRVAPVDDLRQRAAFMMLAMLISAPLGAVVAVSLARSVVTARGGDPGGGIGFVVPALLGAVAAVLLIVLVVAVVLAARADWWRCVWAARRVVLVPVLAALPVLALLFGGSLLVAVAPIMVTGAVAAAVWRSPRVGLVVLVVAVAGGVVVVVVLGPSAVFLLLPHLLLSVGCWIAAAVLLAPTKGSWSAVRA